MKRTPASNGCRLAALVAVVVVFHADARGTARDQGAATSFKAGGLRSFDIVPLETASEHPPTPASAIATATGIRTSCWSKGGTGR